MLTIINITVHVYVTITVKSQNPILLHPAYLEQIVHPIVSMTMTERQVFYLNLMQNVHLLQRVKIFRRQVPGVLLPTETPFRMLSIQSEQVAC